MVRYFKPGFALRRIMIEIEVRAFIKPMLQWFRGWFGEIVMDIRKTTQGFISKTS